MDTQFDMSEATEWFDYLRSCGRKENTINSYRKNLIQMFRCLDEAGRSYRAAEITTDDILYLRNTMTTKEEVTHSYLRTLAGLVIYHTGKDVVKQDRRFDPREGTQHPEVHVRSEIRGVPIIGFIDLLSIRGSMVYIDDWKTGFPGKRDEQQIRIYTMMVSRIMGIPPRDIIATLDYLREEPRRIQKRVPYTSTAAIEQHIEREVIEPINDLQFVPVRGSHCERCEYRKICEAW